MKKSFYLRTVLNLKKRKRCFSLSCLLVPILKKIDQGGGGAKDVQKKRKNQEERISYSRSVWKAAWILNKGKVTYFAGP